MKKEIKSTLELNANENTTHSNLWNTMKAGLGDKFIVLNAYSKKVEETNISSLPAHMKALEQ